MDKPRVKQLILRLYRDNPQHAPFFDWVESLTEDGRGKRLHGVIVNALLHYINSGMAEKGDGERVVVDSGKKKNKTGSARQTSGAGEETRLQDSPALTVNHDAEEKTQGQEEPQGKRLSSVMKSIRFD